MAKSQPFKIIFTNINKKGCPEKLAGTAFFLRQGYNKRTLRSVHLTFMNQKAYSIPTGI